MEPNYARDDNRARRPRGRAASWGESSRLSVYPDREHRRPRRRLSSFVRTAYPPPEAYESPRLTDRVGRYLQKHDIAWCAGVLLVFALAGAVILGGPAFMHWLGVVLP